MIRTNQKVDKPKDCNLKILTIKEVQVDLDLSRLSQRVEDRPLLRI